MWNWLVSKFSKLFTSGKVEQDLPNVKVSQLPEVNVTTPMPKVNAPAKSKFEKYNKPAESKYKASVQSENTTIKVDNTDYVTPYVAAVVIMSGSDDSSCSSKSYSSLDYSSSSSYSSSDSYSSSSSSSSCD